MQKVLGLCFGLLGLAGCMDGGSAGADLSTEQRIAIAFPAQQDRQGIFFAIPQGGTPPTGFRIGYYPDEVTDDEVAARMRKYCAATASGAMTANRVNGGSSIIQADGSTKQSRNRVFTCL